MATDTPEVGYSEVRPHLDDACHHFVFYLDIRERMSSHQLIDTLNNFIYCNLLPQYLARDTKLKLKILHCH